MGFPGGSAGKEPICQHRRRKRCRFNPWVGKISWRRKWPPTLVFLPGKFQDGGAWLATVHGVTKSRTPWAHTATYWFCGSRWPFSSDFLYLRLLGWYPLDSSQAATNFEAVGLMLTLVGGWSLVTCGGWALGRVGAPSPTGMPLFPIPRRRRFLDGMLGHTTWTWPLGSLCGEWSGLGGVPDWESLWKDRGSMITLFHTELSSTRAIELKLKEEPLFYFWKELFYSFFKNLYIFHLFLLVGG